MTKERKLAAKEKYLLHGFLVSIKIIRFRVYDEQDKEKKELAEARNALEAYIYDTRDFLSSVEAVEIVSTPEEQDSLRLGLSDALDWLDDEGAQWLLLLLISIGQENSKSILSTLKSKLSDLKKVGDKIRFRASELVRRPRAAESLRQSLNLTTTLVNNISSLIDVSEKEVGDLLQILVNVFKFNFMW